VGELVVTASNIGIIDVDIVMLLPYIRPSFFVILSCLPYHFLTRPGRHKKSVIQHDEGPTSEVAIEMQPDQLLQLQQFSARLNTGSSSPGSSQRTAGGSMLIPGSPTQMGLNRGLSEKFGDKLAESKKVRKI